MSETDIKLSKVVVYYLEDDGVSHYMKRDSQGGISGFESTKGALMFTPIEAQDFINSISKSGFPMRCMIQPVR